jgi:hypothetical protein
MKMVFASLLTGLDSSFENSLCFLDVSILSTGHNVEIQSM